MTKFKVNCKHHIKRSDKCMIKEEVFGAKKCIHSPHVEIFCEDRVPKDKPKFGIVDRYRNNKIKGRK